jgi:hypothetical protein
MRGYLSPWYYLVVEADSDGVDLILIDSGGEHSLCMPGDHITMSWDDVRFDNNNEGRRWWELVSG